VAANAEPKTLFTIKEHIEIKILAKEKEVDMKRRHSLPYEDADILLRQTVLRPAVFEVAAKGPGRNIG
jgi:hypothetical protein